MSKEDNKAAWKILRETLSNFYAKKNEFYKEKKQENKQIIQNKVVLCEKAEELVNQKLVGKKKQIRSINLMKTGRKVATYLNLNRINYGRDLEQLWIISMIVKKASSKN